MQQLSPSDPHPPQPFLRRLDRMFGEINALLAAVAIGLAVLDFTCFVALRAVDTVDTAGTQMAAHSAVAVPRGAEPPIAGFTIR